MSEAAVRIVGLQEVVAGFRKIEHDLPNELKQQFLGIASHVVGVIQQRMPFVSGAAAGSVKPKATTTGAAIAFGGRAAPYMPWLDFGGTVGKGHKPGVAWSGSVKRPWAGKPAGMGRYVYPAIMEETSNIEAAAAAAVSITARDAGFDA
jgi:hypothetical protein